MSNVDETTQADADRPQTTTTTTDVVAVFRAQPSDRDGFRRARDLVRSRGDMALLGALCAEHAAAVADSDADRAARYWVAAGESYVRADDGTAAVAAWRQSLKSAPGYQRAIELLVDTLLGAQRPSEAYDVLAHHLPLVDQAPSDPIGLATLHKTAADIADEHLTRIDAALSHWRRVAELADASPDTAIEALRHQRRFEAALGNTRNVENLWHRELELLGTTGSVSERAAIHVALAQLRREAGDLASAADQLEKAIELVPGHVEAPVTLAKLYLDPRYPGQNPIQTAERAAALYVELARRVLAPSAGRASAQDLDSVADDYLHQALAACPGYRPATALLEERLRARADWDALFTHYQATLVNERDAAARVALLEQMLVVASGPLDHSQKRIEVLTQLVELARSGNDYKQQLRRAYYDAQDWTPLVAIIEAELPAQGVSRNQDRALCNELLELATLWRECLEDRDRAAEYLHRVLSIEPLHDEGLERYIDHFKERRDWRGLADLYEFVIDFARGEGDKRLALRYLEELARVAELRLGDVDRAITTWHRVGELEPNHRKSRDAVRRLSSRAKMWESLVGVLEAEAQNAQAPRERAAALRRLAQVHRERQIKPLRAIKLFEESLSLCGPSAETRGVLKALTELYEREGDDAGLASTIRRTLELDHGEVAANHRMQTQSELQPRDWPVAKRVERLTGLRRLANLYETRMADVEGVVYACSGILEIIPGDRDALAVMERVLDKAGDSARLGQTLEYHAAAASGPAERVRIYRRLAQLAEQVEPVDAVAAMSWWEQALRAVPTDREAQTHLVELYAKYRRWDDLLTLLEGVCGRVDDEVGVTTAELVGYIGSLETHVGDDASIAARLARLWGSVLQRDPTNHEALEALVGYYEAEGNWRELMRLLPGQLAVARLDDRQRATAIALRLARIADERLGDREAATAALIDVVDNLDPRCDEALQRLRIIYEERGDYERVLGFAERQYAVATRSDERLACAMDVAILARDRLGDPYRALGALTRVIAIDPGHREALHMSAELFQRIEDWDRYLAAMENLCRLAPESQARQRIMTRIAAVLADRRGDSGGALEWLQRAHAENPTSTSLDAIRELSQRFGLWAELASFYDSERRGVKSAIDAGAQGQTASYIALSRELASVVEFRLIDPRRALAVVQDALEIAPSDADLLTEADRIAAVLDDADDWRTLLRCLDTALQAAPAQTAWRIHTRRAQVFATHLEDYEQATQAHLAAFGLQPERTSTLQGIVELADKRDDWGDVLAVEAALLFRSRRVRERIEHLRRLAHVYEHRMADLPRAFRMTLAALFVDPHSNDVAQEAWRLATEIESYDGDASKPDTSLRRAEIQEVRVAADAFESTPTPVIIESNQSRRHQTEELTLADMLDAETAPVVERAATMPIDMSELEPVEDGAPESEQTDADSLVIEPTQPGRDMTMELRTQDLIVALGGQRGGAKSEVADGPRDNAARATVSGPPLPPPRPPQIERHHFEESGPVPRGPQQRDGFTIYPYPVREFQSPWEELAAAYAVLSGGTAEARARWLYRIAEVWELGGNDIPKAFDALASAMEVLPAADEPRERLRVLAKNYGAWSTLIEVLEAGAERAQSADHAVSLLHEVAALYTAQGDAAKSESLFRRILGIQPDDDRTRVALEAIFREHERWVDLAASLEERTDPRFSSAAEPRERPALLIELADIYENKIDRIHDAIDALVRLDRLHPDDEATLTRLIELYTRIGRWSSVIEVLHRIADIRLGSPSAARALHRIAEIYVDELTMPERAVDAYEEIVSTWPEDEQANSGLDSLYAQLARWQELVELLRRRAALTKDDTRKAEFLARRGTVLLEWLGQPEDAVTALRQAVGLTPEALGMTEKFAEALLQAGHDDEATRVLATHLEQLRAGDAPAGELVAALVRLAELEAGHGEGVTEAKRLLDEALSLVPEHPSALAALARVAEHDDPQTYVEARLREADALADEASKIAILLDAGAALRDRCQDGARAKLVFERVLELRPYHPDATWALAGLSEQGGDVELATNLLEARLQTDDLPAVERAKLLTQLAVFARKAGLDSLAERRLHEALNYKGDYVPAVFACAELYESTERYDELREFLVDIIAELYDGDTRTRSELYRMLGIAYEQLGAEDEAYQALLEGDRIDRTNLRLKLALGENRYRARRWREAALHLSACGDHADVDAHREAVAAGLYHAALAEIRARRPERAPALHRRAVELHPGFAPSLQVLAEVAIEAGDFQAAVGYLDKQATATKEADKRVELFDALGEIYLQQLGDSERAVAAFAAGIESASPLRPEHIPLLRKALTQYESLDDWAGAARSAELLASFESRPESRAQGLTHAAKHYIAAGDYDRARAAAQAASEADVAALGAVTLLSEVLLEEGAVDDATGVLGRALNAVEARGGDVASDELALLWCRLGRARILRGDRDGGVSALSRALTIDSKGESALAARRELATVYAGAPDKTGEVCEHLQVIARATGTLDDLAAYAEALVQNGDHERASLLGTLVSAAGVATSDDLAAAVAAWPLRQLDVDEGYRGVLALETRTALLDTYADSPLAQLSRCLWELAPFLWNDAEAALASMGLADATRAGSALGSVATIVYPHIGAALGAPATVLYESSLPDAPEVTMVCATPPLVVLGSALQQAQALATPLPQVRFVLGRIVELTRPSWILAAGMSRTAFEAVIDACYRVFGGDQEPVEPSELERQLIEVTPLKTRSQLRGFCAEHPRAELDIAGYLESCARVADQAGMLACGDLATASRLTTLEDTRHLCEFALHPQFLAALQQLGLWRD